MPNKLTSELMMVQLFNLPCDHGNHRNTKGIDKGANCTGM